MYPGRPPCGVVQVVADAVDGPEPVDCCSPAVVAESVGAAGDVGGEAAQAVAREAEGENHLDEQEKKRAFLLHAEGHAAIPIFQFCPQ